MIGGDHAAGALHVAHDHCRIARNVLAEMPSNHARIRIRAAAGIEPGGQVDGLATIEIGDVVGTGGLQRASDERDRKRKDDFHFSSLWETSAIILRGLLELAGMGAAWGRCKRSRWSARVLVGSMRRSRYAIAAST